MHVYTLLLYYDGDIPGQFTLLIKMLFSCSSTGNMFCRARFMSWLSIVFSMFSSWVAYGTEGLALSMAWLYMSSSSDKGIGPSTVSTYTCPSSDLARLYVVVCCLYVAFWFLMFDWVVAPPLACIAKLFWLGLGGRGLLLNGGTTGSVVPCIAVVCCLYHGLSCAIAVFALATVCRMSAGCWLLMV